MLDRRPLVKTLLTDRPENLLAVSSLGSCTWDLSASGDDARNFCFIGAMGQAAPFAMGLAMAQPNKRVLLFAGDGEMLMGMGSLATIANFAPNNLAILIQDNESYVETGSQPTATSGRTDLEKVAQGCGIATTRTFREDSEIPALKDMLLTAPGPVLCVTKIAPDNLPLVEPYSFDGVTAINRFREAAMS